MSETVLCKDCKHSFIPWSDYFGLGGARYTMRCRKALKEGEVDKNFVTGHTIKPTHYERCSLARIDMFQKESCGEAGKYWEPKAKRDLFKFIKHVSV